MTAPSPEEIREIQRIEAEKISEAIRTGDIEGLRVSNGVFGKSFDHLGKEDLQAYAKKRLAELNQKICKD